MIEPPYRQVIQFCEQCLDQHGDTPAGVGWTAADAATRYGVMLDAVRLEDRPCSVLDFGCGASHLLEFMRKEQVTGIDYHGLELSDPFLRLSKGKFPEIPYYSVDVLSGDDEDLPDFDYIVMNGVLTYKGAFSEAQMFEYCKNLLTAAFRHARKGLAFNVHSKNVDWERADLFHMPVDPMLRFLSERLSRHVQIRHDYGLYEYTIYVYRDAWGPLRESARQTIGRGPE